LLALDLLNGLKERGELLQDPDGTWTASAHLHWNRLPPRLEAVTAERISRLPYKWQALLSAAAVQEDEFISEVVAVVSGIDPAELAQLLSGPLSKQHRLVSAAGLDWYGERRVTRYRFSRQIDRLFLYNDLDEIERKQLHAATGQALEELFLSTGATDSPITRQLAYHFQVAGQVEKAASYLHLSGDGHEPNR
jgi:predicted ATPase